MLEAAGSDLDHITHINIFLKQMSDFEAMNAALCRDHGEIADRHARPLQCRTFPSRRVADDESDGRDG
jgi:enamine deaminase RidA (YjgF/YER057c/UK114 family)